MTPGVTQAFIRSRGPLSTYILYKQCFLLQPVDKNHFTSGGTDNFAISNGDARYELVAHRSSMAHLQDPALDQGRLA